MLILYKNIKLYIKIIKEIDKKIKCMINMFGTFGYTKKEVVYYYTTSFLSKS